MKAHSDNFAGKRPKNFLNTVILLIHRYFEPERRVLELPQASLRFIKKSFGASEK